METNVTKCFICDVECDAEEKFRGSHIARTLTTPMSAVLAKCLRSIVDTENEYFCSECTRKIEEYDQMVQLSLQIETELYELYRKKPIESCYLLDAEIISDQSRGIHVGQADELKLENESPQKATENDLTESYDEMVIEYLDEYETHSNDDELHANEIDENVGDSVADELAVVSQSDAQNDGKVEAETQEASQKGRKKRKPGPKSRTIIKKVATKRRNGKQANDEIDLNCQHCSFAATNRVELEEHKTNEHLEEGKRLACDICGKTYKSKSALCVHLGSHNGRSTHECHMCGKTFTQRGALVRHMPMHTGERPHQCDICGKRFIHYSSFHMHQMVHTNERKKKCHVCGSEFRSNSHLTRHLRTHTKERPYSCEICGQQFAQRYNMKTHYNTHQGIHRPQSKNHKCILCMDAFPRRDKLNKHLRQAHGVSDEDIKILAEKGPNSEDALKILDRLRASVIPKEEVFVEYAKEEVLIEYIEDGDDDDDEKELISPDELNK